MFLFYLIFLFFVTIECSRVLIDSVKRSARPNTLLHSKRFSSSSSQSSSLRNYAKWAAIGAGGLVMLDSNEPGSSFAHNEQRRRLHYTTPPLDYGIAKKRLPLDVPNSFGRTPIFYAVLNKNYEDFLDQIELGANLNTRDKSYVTIMEMVIIKGLSKYFDVLINSEGLDLTETDSDDRPYLFTAIANQRFHFARKIIEKNKVAYEREQLEELFRLACLILPENDVALNDRPEQKALLIDLFFLSKCDRKMVFSVLESLEPDQMDPKIRKSFVRTINDLIMYSICAFI